MLPKLTDEHVIPDKIRKMKVSNCAKVFSERVAATLRYTASFAHREDGKAVSNTMKHTADAIKFFDKLFDSCNGSRGGRCPWKLRGPVKANSQHNIFWREILEILKNIKYVNKSGASENVPSLKNWVTTIESLIRLTDIVLSKGVTFFYTRNFNQDPLEIFFGKIRAYNSRYINPDVYTFTSSFKSILITSIINNMHSKYANCEEDIGETILGLQNLINVSPSVELSVSNITNSAF